MKSSVDLGKRLGPRMEKKTSPRSMASAIRPPAERGSASDKARARGIRGIDITKTALRGREGLPGRLQEVAGIGAGGPADPHKVVGELGQRAVEVLRPVDRWLRSRTSTSPGRTDLRSWSAWLARPRPWP